MHLPIAVLEKRRVQRIVFSIRRPSSRDLSSLMEKTYEMGAWSFDLPTVHHLRSFKALKESTGDQLLTGFGHIGVDSGVSLMGKPLHQFEPKIISTVVRNIIPPESVKQLFPGRSFGEVLTQKEIDRMAFDRSRFTLVLSPFQTDGIPFLIIGGRYGDWLLGLGRVDLLKEMVLEARQQGFIPLLACQWPTFSLPKVKHLEVGAYAVSINKKEGLFDFAQACKLIKQFDRPLISLDPLSDGRLSGELEEAFSFLFEELKVHLAITDVNSEEEARALFTGLEKIPSLIPFRKT